jgi:hypothetical protein
MNCDCVPPKHAVLHVSHNLKSAGREFFSCPTRECKFFAWAGEYIPMSMAFGRNRQANTAKQGNSYAKRDSSPQKVNGKHEVKVMLYEITPPPVEIWLSLQCPSSPVVNDLFARLPQDKVKFSNTLKMWLFSFSVYERVVQEFTTPPFESMHVPELPKFLATGLASYQKKVNKLNKEGEQELNLSPRIVSTLLPFQLEAVKYVVKRGGRALLGDDMGKTAPFSYCHATSSKFCIRQGCATRTTTTFTADFIFDNRLRENVPSYRVHGALPCPLAGAHRGTFEPAEAVARRDPEVCGRHSEAL